jgi:hypothetical protein
MKRAIILILSLTVCLVGQTQTVESRENPFFYDEFKLGFVYHLDGEVVIAKLNYHMVFQEMYILEPETDRVLILVHNTDVTHITVGDDIFVPIGRQYAQVIQDGPVTLLRKRHFVRQEKKKGAYGTPTATAAVDMASHWNFSNAGNAPSSQYIGVPVDYLVLTEYFLMKDRKAHLATRRNFLNLYSDVKPLLDRFLRENSVDFKNEQHLRGLTKYANSLLLAK